MKLPRRITATLCIIALLLFSAATGAAEKKENPYPNATRSEPKLEMSSSDQNTLNKAADLVNEDQDAQAQPLIDKVLANKRASKYAQAFAHQLQAQVLWEQDKDDQAIAEYQKAVDLDALPNKAQFQVIYQIAQLQIQQEKYADALATLDKWTKLTGSETAEELALRGNAYYRTDKYQQAIDTMKKAIAMADKPNDSWMQILMASYFELDQYDQAAAVVEQQIAKDPHNKKLYNQLATIYIQGDKDDQALATMAKAKSLGLITTSDDYLQLAKLSAAANKPKDAAATLKEGFDKNILKPSYETYKLEGDVCLQAGDDACAMAAYAKASPLAPDGNIDYQLGYELYYADRSKDAKEALTRAITKGSLRQEGEAYLLRGDAESDLNQSKEAMADWTKARGYASTKTMAEQRIKATKGGVKLRRSKKK
ncbi:MAG: tetratricopeptide repeat protein [Rhodanobacteraceae bacterium]